MKLLLTIGLAISVSGLSAVGQTLDENLKPKTPPVTDKKSKLPDAPAVPQMSPEDQVQVTEKLAGLVFVKSKEEIKREGLDGIIGVKVMDVSVLGATGFPGTLAAYLDKPAMLGTLKAIQRDVILYCRQHDRPLVDVIIPNQEVNPTNGVVQVVVIEGRAGKITVNNEGRRWFSDESIINTISIHPGDAISEKKLLADIDWLNRNPFRDVVPGFRQGEQAGLSDLQLEVRDRVPIRVFGGYEDSGTEATGRDRLLAGFNWGNAFGQGHQLNYQYSTDAEFDTLVAHSASYIIPLPWRHTLSIYGTYVDIDVDVDAGTTSTALNYQGAVRYSVPLPMARNYQHEAFAGFDFKHNETDLLFGGRSSDLAQTEVVQLVLGYNGSLSDRWGRTSFGLQGYFSPGEITSHNDDMAYGSERPSTIPSTNFVSTGAEANYYYTRLSVERVTRLPWNCSLILRAGGQVSSGNLIPSEQLGVGGYNTARGYDEREANGSRGIASTVELRSPAFSVAGRYPRYKVDDQLQFLAFMDYGIAENNEPLNDESTAHLHSVGGGLRYTVTRFLSFRFDYAVQLHDSGSPVTSDYGSRAHIGAIISY